MENTRVEYLYRDASNYKKHNEVVVSGACSKEDIDYVMGEVTDFIPEQLGLPLLRPDDNITEDDHCYAELISIEETDEPATISMTWEELLSAFKEAIDGGWDDVTYAV